MVYALQQKGIDTGNEDNLVEATMKGINSEETYFKTCVQQSDYD